MQNEEGRMQNEKAKRQTPNANRHSPIAIGRGPSGGFEIWTTWPGTHYEELPPPPPPQKNRSVIYGVRIPWAQP
jgi:hypothetical protein